MPKFKIIQKLTDKYIEKIDGVAKDKEKEVFNELNVNKKVQDLSNSIVDLKKQKRSLDKSIFKLEKELERIFDNAGVDYMEIQMGVLTRRKLASGEYEWIVEL